MQPFKKLHFQPLQKPSMSIDRTLDECLLLLPLFIGVLEFDTLPNLEPTLCHLVAIYLDIFWSLLRSLWSLFIGGCCSHRVLTISSFRRHCSSLPGLCWYVCEGSKHGSTRQRSPDGHYNPREGRDTRAMQTILIFSKVVGFILVSNRDQLSLLITAFWEMKP